MKNRISENPGRVLIAPENGSAPFYATMTRADNPTQEGDPLNKNTLLKDATAALFGLGTDAVPDDALVALKDLIGNNKDSIADLSSVSGKVESGSYVGTGVFTSNKVVNFQGKPIIFAIEKSLPKANANIFVRPFLYGTYNPSNAPSLAAWKENSVSITAHSSTQWSDLSMNTSGQTYNWVAICL